MKAKWFARTRAIGQGGAVALLTAALVFSAAARVVNRPDTRLGKVVLTATTNFSITSTISDSSSSETAALLYPGAPRYLWYTVHNPLLVPITVDAISIQTVTPPVGCPTANLDVSNTTFNGSLVVPARVGLVEGTNSVWVPISLVDTGANQDACKNATFDFTYTGTATYTEVYATSTALTSSVDPSNVGQSVTYTATVTGVPGAGQDPLPNSPTGTVTFKDGATTICTVTGVPVTTATATTSTASCTPPTYAVTGTHPITAEYTNTDDNFTGSTASALNQVVKFGTSTALTTTPNPSIQGTSVTLSATVTKVSGSGTPTGSVSFYRGTPPGGTLLGTGTLNAGAVATFATSALPPGANSLYAVYGGNTLFNTSTSPVITQNVIALPAACSGPYNLIVGNPSSPTVNGTNGNDFIYAVGTGNFVIDGGQGNDCIQAGDGTNAVTAGNGDNKVLAGNGTNSITAGNGTNWITVGNGSNSLLTAGNGNNTFMIGTGANNTVTAGNGANTVTIATPGNHDTITFGNGKNVAYLGGGTFNEFTGGKNQNTCHLPSLPASAFNDTLVNCTAVAP